MISIALTNYNRTTQLLDSFKQVWDDERINEIVIVDDKSELEVQEFLVDNLANKPKINLILNEINIGMAANKAKSIHNAMNDWCILLDSDNVINKSYIDALFRSQPWDWMTIYNPSFARPHFNFSHFAGQTISRHNVKKFIKKKNFDSVTNACNYFVNKQTYLENFVLDSSIKGTDTSFFFYNWLKRGGKMKVVKGMEYEHAVHDGSEFLKDLEYNMQRQEQIKKMIEAL